METIKEISGGILILLFLASIIYTSAVGKRAEHKEYLAEKKLREDIKSIYSCINEKDK